MLTDFGCPDTVRTDGRSHLFAMYTILVAVDLFFMSSALHVVRDSPQQVILVNTPPCATGSLQQAFVRGLPCQDKTVVQDPHFMMTSCPDGNFVFLSHELEPAANYSKQHGWFVPQKGRCVLVTAFSNPLSQVKSKFFDQHKPLLCNGPDLKSGVLREAFKAWIHGEPTEEILGSRQLLDHELLKHSETPYQSAVLARMYGLHDYTAVLHGVSGNGGFLHIASSKAPAGEFGDCELLILQAEKLKHQYLNIKRILPMMQEFHQESFLASCPSASRVLDEIETFELSPSEKKLLFEANPEMEPTWNLYGLDASTE